MTEKGWIDPPVVDVPYSVWSPEHDAVRAQVRTWVDEQITPFVEHWEHTGDLPRDIFPAAAEIGLFGWKVTREAGGTGPDFRADAVIAEELAGAWSGGVAAALGAHKDLGPYYLWRFGTDEQRSAYMPDFLAGTRIGALAVTEPGAGSDVAGLQTRAVRDGSDWLLNGSKTFITNGHWADVVVVAAVTDPDAGGHHGMTLFLVERGDPGFESRRMSTLGWRTSSTGELSFSDVRLPAERVIGGEEMLGSGFLAIMHNFQWERIGMALGAVRHAQDVVAVAASALGGDLIAEVDAARSLVYRALRGYLSGVDVVKETSMAKWYACDLSVRVCEAALHAGGWPALVEGRLERTLRDARLGPIGGGTTEIMKEVVGRTLGL
jgi:acyl-CoA dehydrogenase